jgi:predicted nucleic-acid-binding protein
MIALDTNVLVRFLVSDDPVQTAKVKALIGREISAGRPCFVSDVVVCETIWVLKRGYRCDRRRIAEILRSLLATDQLEWSNSPQIERALQSFEAGRGDFPDYLIREQARSAGFREVATFDQDLHREAGFFEPS